MQLGGNRAVLAALALLYVAGALLRLQDPHAPGTLVEREFRSAIIARSVYFEMDPSIPDWRERVARTSRQREGRLEPPLTELLVALCYRVTDGERLWISRFLTSAFWLIGGPFLLAIARRVVSPGVALVPLGFYLLAPLGVTTSRSFQPDSLMILLLLVALHAMLRHSEQPSPRRFVAAVVSSAAAVLAKPFVGPMLILGFASLVVHRKGWRRALGGELVLFVVLTLLPAALWFGYGPLAGVDAYDVGIRSAEGRARPGSRTVEQILQTSAPELLLRRSFWTGWLRLVATVVGPLALTAGLIGFALFRQGPVRALVAGLGAAYFVFGIATSARIADHGYYHLQLIPVVALCLAPLAEGVLRWTGSRQLPGRLVLVGAALLLVGWLGSSVRGVRRHLTRAQFESPDLCWEVGELVQHSTRTVYVARHYGRPLEYLGELSGVPWPKGSVEGELGIGQTVQQRLDLLTFEPEFFIVTDVRRLELFHQDLQAWLEEHCAVVVNSAEYSIYSRCETGSDAIR